LGNGLSGKFHNTLKYELSEKNLYFSKGMIFHIEKIILLEKIQDLSFIGGPILRLFGLTFIKVEIAGGVGVSHINMMSMPGVEDAAVLRILFCNSENWSSDRNCLCHMRTPKTR
jgi:membrane protein YdbS with pleckstrin-like domain